MALFAEQWKAVCDYDGCNAEIHLGGNRDSVNLDWLLVRWEASEGDDHMAHFCPEHAQEAYACLPIGVPF